MRIHTKFNGYEAGRRLYFKGGDGGGSVKYDNLEKLYEEQTASARLLRGIAEQNLPGATQAYVGNVQNVLAPDYANRQANMAGVDMFGSNAMERAATERSLASMGVNPNDPRFAGSLRSTQLNNAARIAAGKNLARNETQQYQLNVAKDAVGTFTGQSNNSATQMGNAASGLGSVYANQQNQQMARQQAQSQAIGNAVGGSLMAWSMFKDGGKVNGVELKKILRRADGGEVRGEDYGYGARTDGTPKGRGYFGELKRPDGDISTELSIGINLGGNETEIPLLVPVLSRAEIDHLLSGGEPTESIVRKAADHAKQRIQAGKSPYAGPGETSPLPAVAGIGTKKIERHMLGGTAGGQQNQGFFQMQQIAPPPVAAAPQQQQSMLNPTSMASAMKAGKDFKAAGGMEGAAARNTDRIGKIAGAFDEQAGNAIQSYSRGMAMSPDQANTAAKAYVEAAKTAETPALADAYMNTAANIQAGAGGQLTAAPVAEAMALNPATGLAEGTTAALGEAGVAAGTEQAAMLAAQDAAMAGAGAAAEGVAGAAAAEGVAAAGAEAAATGLGTAAGALGAALPWVGAAYAVGSLLDWWNEGGQVGTQNKGMSEAEAMRRFSDAFNAGEVNDLRAGGDVPGEWRENVDTVPALLVEGEGVLNAEAMALGGEKVMEDLNAKGLALREQGITPHDIKRGIGLRGLKKVKA